MDLSNITYYGNTTYDIILFILIIFFGIIAGRLFNTIIKRKLKKIVSKTKTKFDDIIFDAIELPASILIFVLFFYFALNTILIPKTIGILLYELIDIMVIIGATWFVLNFTDSFIQHYIIPRVNKTESTFDDHIIVPLRKLLKLIIICLGLLMAIDAAGYNISTLLAGLGIGGLAVALAAQDTVKNFISGVLLIIDKPFKLNQWIEFDGVEGVVEDIGIRSTKIRTFNDSLIIVPNAVVINANIENHSEMKKRRVKTIIGLTYDTPVDKCKLAKEIIHTILEDHRTTLPPYRITFNEFGAHSLNFRLEYFIRNMGFDYYLNAVDDINMRIKEEFEKEGIEMAFPTQTIYLKKGDN
ncbi:mechanosensitive ion channel family protein [Methanococcus aeolicus]|uniref:MscS Mechanosensitive ion channel n=1 Tax=Methanococcus aeolicus (strain ATCC BAA-1280 / DSM 17508 / OCM 812 / Nankai-3) TaxID=419665 RepID=A6UTG5_META3|nr:mechanosensitive ion channel family protein [Methanococcus aeolicus]ABR55787.1 MscS Mechanosensitive ion channel [Methanococcus aeolicus Nankai-3]UXM84107.1 mechanosensitive ion channel family protein [Methanococcus aeolicus]